MKKIKDEELEERMREENSSEDNLSVIPDDVDEAEALSGLVESLRNQLSEERSGRKAEVEGLIRQISHIKGAFERKIQILEATIIRIEMAATVSEMSKNSAIQKQ